MTHILKPLSESDKEALEKLFSSPGYPVLLRVLGTHRDIALMEGAKLFISKFPKEKASAEQCFDVARSFESTLEILQKTTKPETHVQLEIQS